ncbi:MAG TPA: C25 family cysteine peptidase, partial [Tenuifilaceae bacterium]|nr:C25 family cysteine peptidase [Tenuifilaceae bacterium]
MRKFLLIIVAMATISFGNAQTYQKIELGEIKNEFRVTNRNFEGLQLQSDLSSINLKGEVTKNGEFVTISADNLVRTFNPGMPDLPVVSKLIEVPFGANVVIKIVSYKEEIIDLNSKGISLKIIPAQPSVSKSEDTDKLPFYFDEKVYTTNEYINQEIAFYEESGIMRDKRIGRVELRPIQYNPVANTLKVLNNLVVDISFENPDEQKTNDIKQKYSSPYFNGAVNTINNLNSSKSILWDTPVTYVIVSDPMFETQLQEFIEWKRLKGFHVIEGYTDDPSVGTTTTSIKAYLQNLYNNPAAGVNPPTFVLFVGDYQQVTSFSSSEIANHVTDLRFCEYTNDNIPEVFYGRFSAQNTSQLQPQIDKTLLYEKYQMADPSYLGTAMLVAGVDSDWAPTAGNGAINYSNGYYVNEAHGVNPLTYLYNDAANSTVMASNNSEAAASILGYMNQGLGFANYTAHCSPDGWYNPSFEIPNVNSLTNVGKYGIWIGNCCQSLMFATNDACFGEAGLRKENGGAIGIIGGTESTYWYEDYWWGIGLKDGDMTANPTYEETGEGVYDAVYHDKANELNNPESWYIAQGQFNMVGNLAVEASTSTRKQYYWEIYHLMGDPSLVPYLRVPFASDVTPSPSTLLLGMTSLTVNTVPYAYVALSQDGELVATNIANSSGTATLTFESSALSVGEADLVVTAQNFQPYIGTISVTPADEPYVVLNSFTTSATPNYGQTIDINAVFENVSESPYNASNVQGTITTESIYATINDNSASVGTVNAGAQVSINEAFNVTIANNVPDQTPIVFTLNLTAEYNGDDYNWTESFTLTANAPVLSIGEVTISDGGS